MSDTNDEHDFRSGRSRHLQPQYPTKVAQSESGLTGFRASYDYGSRSASQSRVSEEQEWRTISEPNGDNKLLDTHFLELDPAWLKQFPENDQKTMFLQRILPLLALKVYEHIDKLNTSPSPPFEALRRPNRELAALFEARDFTPNNIIDRFSKDCDTRLAELHYFLVLERARVMYEKLWRECEEWCLLGFAYSCPIEQRYTPNRGERSILSERKIVEVMQRTYSENLESARARAKLTGNIGWLDHVPEVHGAINKLNNERPEVRFTKLLLANHANFMTMKGIYEDNNNLGTASGPVYQKGSNNWDREDEFVELWTFNDQCDWKGDRVAENIWRVYQEGPVTPGYGTFYGTRSQQWSTTCHNVRIFCQYHGINDLTHDPLENLFKLRASIIEQNYRDKFLLRQIDQLKEEKNNQAKVITALAYRSLMENLPPRGHQQFSQFFTAAMKVAKEGTFDTPFKTVINKVDMKYEKRLNHMIGDWFSVFSGEIHKYSDWASVRTDIDSFPSTYKIILRALKPIYFKSPDNKEVDWEAERTRYGIDWSFGNDKSYPIIEQTGSDEEMKKDRRKQEHSKGRPWQKRVEEIHAPETEDEILDAKKEPKPQNQNQGRGKKNKKSQNTIQAQNNDSVTSQGPEMEDIKATDRGGAEPMVEKSLEPMTSRPIMPIITNTHVTTDNGAVDPKVAKFAAFQVKKLQEYLPLVVSTIILSIAINFVVRHLPYRLTIEPRA